VVNEVMSVCVHLHKSIEHLRETVYAQKCCINRLSARIVELEKEKSVAKAVKDAESSSVLCQYDDVDESCLQKQKLEYYLSSPPGLTPMDSDNEETVRGPEFDHDENNGIEWNG